MTNCYVTWYRKEKGNRINMNVSMNVFLTLSRSLSASLIRTFMQQTAAVYGNHGDNINKICNNERITEYQ